MTPTNTLTNGIDTAALADMAEAVSQDHRNGIARFQVATAWKGGTRTESRVDSWEIAGERKPKNFAIATDEPPELLGNNSAANPQEVLMAAMNACMMVGYVAGCAQLGIELENLEIRTEGELDLRGFLALDDSVKPGYDTIRYEVRIKGNGTPEQFQQVHDAVTATSPNRWNIANPIRLESELIVE